MTNTSTTTTAVQDTPLPWEQDLLVPIEDIKEQSQDLVLKIYDDWGQINLAVVQLGSVIRDRWLKMNDSQRKAILLRASPNLPPKHRPDMDRCLLEVCPHQRCAEGIAQYAFPHLNLEDLTAPNSLLILLDARTRHAPFKFALSDYELAPLMKLRPALLEKTKYSISLSDNDFGKVIEWDTEEEATGATLLGDAVHPVQGWHILIIQMGLYDFLVRCIAFVMLDELEVSAEPLPSAPQIYNDDFSTLDIAPKESPERLEYGSLDSLIRDAQYRVPMFTDLGRLCALTSACKDAAEDHIWMLREDPSYFAETVLECKEHRPEVLKGRFCGRLHKNGHHDRLWARVLKDTAANAYVDFFVWDEIHWRMRDLNALAMEHVNSLSIDPIKLNIELPATLLESLVQTWSFLELIELDLIQQLKTAWPSSPTMRANFAQQCGEVSDEEQVLGVQAKNAGRRKRDKESEHISKLFEYLWKPDVRARLKVHILVDALSHLLRTNKRANALTSSWVASLLSQLSIVSECLRQLNFLQPWAKKVAHTVKLRQTELLAAHCSTFARWHAVLHTDFQSKKLIRLGEPRSQFRYPVNKRRTRANVNAMQAAEAALDAFWQAADERFVESTGSTPHAVIEHLMQERTLQRTSPWEDPVEAQPAEPSKKQVECFYVPFSNTLHDPAQQVTGSFDKLAVSARAKTKTHGLARNDNGQKKDDVENGKDGLQPRFAVDKRTYSVFRNLFYSPLSKDHPGNLPWQDFLHAMVAVGFAAQKLQGSAWQFTPTKLNVEQPIQFHEPHPTHKLPFTWARRFGRRLARTYGWRGDMFQLAESL
ncbi:uncharacterized protein M421DRAFT_98882 [Didymella exigua CBS 183.55]|uniref:Uncharacterized protein n=1 Tax=Didymella exigua CBS 183.55 TaxID=1150837 RepID=A0A6A5RTR1_9PLEO|nr:uncharacterized protein M421DRAFT_98882 [Didymella exigua CBS 183.55]KAF1931801.1 hypothetical protein M421DRAFT_98882 [Didymella exigua CBS 183.55]